MPSDRLLVLAAGLLLIAAINWYFFFARRPGARALARPGGIQETTITIKGGYSPAEIHVAAGQPVRLVFDRQETNPCSDELVMPEFQISRPLPAHQRTAVEFTPPRPGIYPFHCGMGMLHGKVIAE